MFQWDGVRFRHLDTRSHRWFGVGRWGSLGAVLDGAVIGRGCIARLPRTRTGSASSFRVHCAEHFGAADHGRILLRWAGTNVAGVIAISRGVGRRGGWILLAVATALVTAQFSWGRWRDSVWGPRLFSCCSWGVGRRLRRFWRCSLLRCPGGPGRQVLKRLLACTFAFRSRCSSPAAARAWTCGLTPPAGERRSNAGQRSWPLC